MILRDFSSGPIDTNFYLLGCNETKKAWIVDAPSGAADVAAVEAKNLGLTVEKIILTHSHWDHIADLSLLKKIYPVTVAVHQEDMLNVEHPGSDGLALYLPIEGVKVDEVLQGNEEFSLGKLHIQIIHTPGHSPGGICLYLADQKVLISGDTLFKGSLGRIDLPTSEPERMWVSLKRLSKIPSDVKVFPGHGPSTTIGSEGWLARAEEFFS
jgi:glyoxylase-like metal-dependent hydrolase (beta-lactamase superfamily II)